MLTADHIDVRRKGDELVLRRLDDAALGEARELAGAYLDAARTHVGHTREALMEAWSVIDESAQHRRIALGIKKLVEEGCTFDEESDADAVAVRRALFEHAAAQRLRGEPIAGEPLAGVSNARPDRSGEAATSSEVEHGVVRGLRGFDRDAALRDAARDLGRTPGDIERLMFADLRGEQVLRSAPGSSPESIVSAYEIGRAQAILLRAVRVVCNIRIHSPGAARAFFNWLKFQKLLFAVEREGDGRHRITIDGPFSMFQAVTRYGQRFALLLPALRAQGDWSLEADVLWGKERRALVFHLESDAPRPRTCASLEGSTHVSPDGSAHVSDEVRDLADAVRALAKQKPDAHPWEVAIANAILEEPGVGVCIPDLVLTHRDSKERVFVEVLGYWSRNAVFDRVELASRGLGERIIFCANARLRVSAELIADDAPAALYVFKGKPNARALLDRVDAVLRARALKPSVGCSV